MSSKSTNNNPSDIGNYAEGLKETTQELNKRGDNLSKMQRKCQELSNKAGDFLAISQTTAKKEGSCAMCINF
jgi:hypothetical protein